MTEQTFTISEAGIREIDQWLTKYPADRKQSAVIPALHIVQRENNNWLSEAAMNAVAAYLGMPNVAVYEVATFYSMYELKPIGKHKIAVCTNVPCMLRGSEEVVAHLEKRLCAKMGETTKDGQFTLRAVECLAACASAPVMQVDDQVYYEKLTVEKIDELLDQMQQEHAHDK